MSDINESSKEKKVRFHKQWNQSNQENLLETVLNHPASLPSTCLRATRPVPGIWVGMGFISLWISLDDECGCLVCGFEFV